MTNVLKRCILMAALCSCPAAAMAGFCDSDADCNDGNQCTLDDCLGAPFGFCTNTPRPSGFACGSSTTTDCTLPDTCNGAGACLVNHKSNGTVCTDDTNPCTNDTCSNGNCIHTAKANGTPCTDDGNQCTSDSCTSATCTHPNKPNGTPCGDGNSCTTNDVCNGAGACAGTPVPDCGGCPLGSLLYGETGRERILGDFRDYRDTVLATTAEGRFYADLYYHHADEVKQIIESSPDVRREAIAAVLQLLPVLEDVLIGKETVVTSSDVQTVDRLLARIQRQAGAELAADIGDFRIALQKGRALETFNVRLETGRTPQPR